MRMYKFHKDYFITDTGDLYSLKNKNIIKMKPGISGSGYYTSMIRINNNDKPVRIHRLVAEAFCKKDGRKKGLVVNHKDCNKLNNNYENLEWVTRQYDAQHSTMNGRRGVVVNFDIAEKIKKCEGSAKYVAKVFGVSTTTVYRIRNDNRWNKNRSSNGKT